MDDQEKIHHLKNEIDNLRNQLRDVNGGSINRASVTATEESDDDAVFGFVSGSMAAMVVFLLAILVVVRRRWRHQGGTSGYRYAAGTSMMNMMMMPTTTTTNRRSPELMMTFELQDAHDYALPTRMEPSQGNHLSYAAPSSDIQFV